MSWQTARDVSLQVTSPSTSGEQRISPTWSISHLKKKLESITGIPPSSQRLRIKAATKPDGDIDVEDEDAVQIGSWGLSPASEIEVIDTRPVAMQNNFNLTDAENSGVAKYVMPEETYSALPDSVLAWKKTQKLGRFDPRAPAVEATKAAASWEVLERRGIVVGRRCQIGEEETRRGVVRFVGQIEELPGIRAGAWVGVELDEPVGKNDGFVGEGEARRRVFECGAKRGVFVRPDRVAVGDFPVLEMGLDEDMEEI